MTDRSPNEERLAVLIDAENVRVSAMTAVMDEIAKLGLVGLRRAYGDFTMTSLQGWRAELLSLAIQPMQQFRNVSGKSITDSSLIIDAMDLLHSGRFSGYCIVSSDSDFTRLATRIRDDGFSVYGFGEKKTPQAFVKACTKFVHIELLQPKTHAAGSIKPGKSGVAKLPLAMLRAAVEASEDEAGWASLSVVGKVLGSRRPDFDAREYGFQKLSALFKASELVEHRLIGEPGGSQQVFVKLKRT